MRLIGSRRKKRGPRGRKKSKIATFARRLRRNTPASERWFQSLWEPFRHELDQYNVPLGRIIPDVHNSHFMYAIEVDGSIHNTPYQKYIDSKKDKYYQKRGYDVFRVRAYNLDDFNATVELVERKRARFDKPLRKDVSVFYRRKIDSSKSVRIERRGVQSTFAKVTNEIDRSPFHKEILKNGAHVVLDMKGSLVDVWPAQNTYLVRDTGKTGTDALRFVAAARKKFLFGEKAIPPKVTEKSSVGKFNYMGAV